jgi:hypothetical protein
MDQNDEIEGSEGRKEVKEGIEGRKEGRRKGGTRKVRKPSFLFLSFLCSRTDRRVQTTRVEEVVPTRMPALLRVPTRVPALLRVPTRVTALAFLWAQY